MADCSREASGEPPRSDRDGTNNETIQGEHREDECGAGHNIQVAQSAAIGTAKEWTLVRVCVVLVAVEKRRRRTSSQMRYAVVQWQRKSISEGAAALRAGAWRELSS